MKYIKVILIALVFITNTSAQKRNKSKLSQTENAFNPQQVMGSNSSDARDDYLWRAESAKTIYTNALDINTSLESRFGYNKNIELSSNLGLAYWIPNLYLKKKWYDKKIVIATKHGIYSTYTGLRWANNNNVENSIEVENIKELPIPITLSNKVILSYAFLKDLKCITKQPFIILSAILGTDYGVNLKKTDNSIYSFNQNFLVPRMNAITGNGINYNIALRIDYLINSNLYFSSQMNYLTDNIKSNFYSLENHSYLQFFFSRHLSISGGFLYSIDNYPISTTLSIIPFFNIGVHLGKKQGRENKLFDF